MTNIVSARASGILYAPKFDKSRWSSPHYRQSLKRRYRREIWFKWLGRGAIAMAMMMLVVLMFSVVKTGIPAFTQTWITLDIHYDEDVIYHRGHSDADVMRAGFYSLARRGLVSLAPDASRRTLRSVVSRVGAESIMRNAVLEDRSLIGQTRTIQVQASSDVDQYIKTGVPRRLSEETQALVDRMRQEGRIETKFNWQFFSIGSREPELAGILPGLVGSAMTLVVTLALAFPVSVAAAVYLQEFAPKNKFTDLIEVNINNLAAVPSIVFGLLGLAVFLNFFGMPRSAPLVGGVVLALMSLPTIIIAARASLNAVPPSIREAALGVGASKLQTIAHHVLPLALPGIMTGTIIAMAQALGETAPLLLIGMESFITEPPANMTEAATVLPVQIYQFAGFPEKGFVEKSAAAIIVLLVFMILMNATAIILRNKFERRW